AAPARSAGRSETSIGAGSHHCGCCASTGEATSSEVKRAARPRMRESIARANVAPSVARKFTRPEKPPLRLQPTTLWEDPSQHYGHEEQGSSRYVGATPSWVIWNVIERYTKPGELVVDPMCGSGTTLDVARDTGRKARGFDVHPFRDDVERADARTLPLRDG